MLPGTAWLHRVQDAVSVFAPHGRTDELRGSDHGAVARDAARSASCAGCAGHHPGAVRIELYVPGHADTRHTGGHEGAGADGVLGPDHRVRGADLRRPSGADQGLHHEGVRRESVG